MRGRDLQYFVVFECPECGRQNKCVLKYQRSIYQCQECPDCGAREVGWPAVEGPRQLTTEERQELVAIDHDKGRQAIQEAMASEHEESEA